MAAADLALSVDKVTKSYGATIALSGASLDVAPGEMVALIGASGSGKSTLLRLASGLVLADAGSGAIRLFLAKRSRKTASSLQKCAAPAPKWASSFKQFNLVTRASLYANAMLGSLGQIAPWRGITGSFPNDVRKRAMEALERVGVADHAANRAANLSGGQQQRGAIARALVQRAQAIFADEPIASLDPVSARRVMRLLAELNEQDGLTVVVTLHQVDYALKYCRRAVALKAGKIIYDGPISGLTRERLIEIYGDEYRDVMDEEPVRA